MDAGHADRLRAWLDREETRAFDPTTVKAARAAVVAPAPDTELVALMDHGTTACFAPPSPGRPRRRILEFDRDGTLTLALRWTENDTLAEGWIRIPDRSWAIIEPRVSVGAPWGLSDRLWHAESLASPARASLTVFEALDWGAIDRIPALLEPARLPPGAGTAVLNVIARLALDQGRTRLAYHGPYPTERLFLALLESFRCVPAPDGPADPVAAFMAGRLTWMPAPHERRFTEDGVYTQLRGRIEKVVWQGRTYYRPDWEDVERHAPRRLRDTADGVRASLCALGAVLEDHLVLDPETGAARRLAEPPSSPPGRPVPAAVTGGVAAVVAAASAPPLAASIKAIAGSIKLTWAPLAGDLIASDGEAIQLSSRLCRLLTERLRAAPSGPARAAQALAALTEIAELVGDELRSRAQARLAACPADDQLAALTVTTAADPADARAIVAAVEALIADYFTSIA